MNQLQKLLVNIPDWNAFFDYSKNLSNKEKGDLFEKLTELIFKTKSIYRSRFKNVWLLSEGIDLELRNKLNLPKADEGIDIIAENYTGTFCAIQCKFKGAHESPTRKDIATFLDLSRNHCKNITEQILVHTGINGIKKTELLPDSFTQIGLDFWSQLTEEDWLAIQLLIKGGKVTSVKRNPRPHQQEAIAASVQYFLNDKRTRGKLIMPCGTGKSLTAFWIAQALASRTTIIAVPSLALLKQSLEDWTKEMLVFNQGELPEWCCVCSDQSAGKISDDFVTDTYSLGIPTTTNAEEITTFLKRKSPGGKVIFTTYQSADKLVQVSRSLEFKFDLAILDEAHKTVGAKDKAFSVLLQEDKISISKRLFMTATERIVKGAESEILSMDDASVYGNVVYKLSFKKAIEEGIITDYKIVTVFVSDAEIQNLIKKNNYITDDNKEVGEAEAQMLTTAIALKKAIKEYNLTHTVSFHKSINASKEFQSLYQKIDTTEDSPTVFHISSKLNAGARAELLRDFRNTSKAIITNARCLTEGVDVPAIDCVLFADQKQSIVDIVQASGRALRQYTDKKTGLKKEVGYIIIPVVLRENESLDDLTDSDRFKTVVRIVTSLSTQDETIAEELKLIDTGKVKASSSKIQVIGTINKSIKLDLSRLSLMIHTRIWERIAKINVLEFEEARSYSRSLNIQGYKEWLLLYDLGKIPKDIPKFPDGALEYKGKFKGWPDWLGNEENSIESNFKKGIKELEEYILSHGNSYVPEKHLTKSGFKLGQFCKMARQGTIKVKDRIDAINKITGWVWDTEEDKFQKMFEALKQFIAINNCLPNKGLNNTDVKIGDYKINLGTWVFTLRSTYNKIQSGVVPATSNKRLLKDKNDPRIKLLESLPNWEWSLKIENMPFDEARGVVRKLKLKGRVDYTSWWRKLGKNITPKIPAKPDKTYSKTGWLGWSDWIGIKVISNQEKGKEKFSYEEAKAFLKNNCGGIINSMSKFNKWKKGELTINGLPVFPYRMPSAPQNAYIKNGEWISNYDFFGTIPKLVKKTKRIDFNLKKMPYQELKDVVQEQKLYSKAEYIKWLEKYKYELKEKGCYAPVKPESYGKEFEGWPIFLGKISV